MSYPAMRKIVEVTLQHFEGLHRAFLPCGFRPLSIHVRDGFPILFAEVEPGASSHSVEYTAVTTEGQYAAPINSSYVGSFLPESGREALHFFFLTEQ